MNRVWIVLALLGTVLGGALGAWVTAGFYRGRVEAAHLELARCIDAGKALEARLVQQNYQLDALDEAARQRTQAAQRALAAAEDEASAHEAAARRLLLERSEGDECVAVRRLVDEALLR